ncbi:hypothetical protein K8I61_06100 [bacterium]|nr:hypothetical protein [bacterium]
MTKIERGELERNVDFQNLLNEKRDIPEFFVPAVYRIDFAVKNTHDAFALDQNEITTRASDKLGSMSFERFNFLFEHVFYHRNLLF